MARHDHDLGRLTGLPGATSVDGTRRAGAGSAHGTAIHSLPPGSLSASNTREGSRTDNVLKPQAGLAVAYAACSESQLGGDAGWKSISSPQLSGTSSQRPTNIRCPARSSRPQNDGGC